MPYLCCVKQEKLKESKNDKDLYKPLDRNFLVMNTRYSVGDYFDKNKITKEDNEKYNRQIEDFLIDRGYLKINWNTIDIFKD